MVRRRFRPGRPARLCPDRRQPGRWVGIGSGGAGTQAVAEGSAQVVPTTTAESRSGSQPDAAPFRSDPSGLPGPPPTDQSAVQAAARRSRPADRIGPIGLDGEAKCEPFRVFGPAADRQDAQSSAVSPTENGDRPPSPGRRGDHPRRYHRPSASPHYPPSPSSRASARRAGRAAHDDLPPAGRTGICTSFIRRDTGVIGPW